MKSPIVIDKSKIQLSKNHYAGLNGSKPTKHTTRNKDLDFIFTFKMKPYILFHAIAGGPGAAIYAELAYMEGLTKVRGFYPLSDKKFKLEYKISRFRRYEAIDKLVHHNLIKKLNEPGKLLKVKLNFDNESLQDLKFKPVVKKKIKSRRGKSNGTTK